MVGLVDVFNTLLGDSAAGESDDAETMDETASTTEALAQHGNLLDEPDTSAAAESAARGDDPLWNDPTWDPEVWDALQDPTADVAMAENVTPSAPDDFDLLAWLDQEGASEITDYDPAQEQLVLVYDPQVHSAPEVTVETAAKADGAQSLIYLDGHKVAEVAGSVSASDITLLAAR